MFRIESKDFEKLYKMADALVETRSYLQESHEVLAATALMSTLDLAKENNETHLIFSENEVQCLSVLFGDNEVI